ncbi:MAG: hypothetical protein MSC43_04510 [Clostridiales bacterium]|nr:hypothetical protein [Clostridiales bacterium]MDD7432606.1 hypothetical protein [Clostridiales bacterium]MDY3061833.1 hypothetical protein [Eubacteriales bacterium]
MLGNEAFDRPPKVTQSSRAAEFARRLTKIFLPLIKIKSSQNRIKIRFYQRIFYLTQRLLKFAENLGKHDEFTEKYRHG